jgi:hypothetical protein
MMKYIKKNNEVWEDFDEYNAKIRSQSWQIFAHLTERSI